MRRSFNPVALSDLRMEPVGNLTWYVGCKHLVSDFMWITYKALTTMLYVYLWVIHDIYFVAICEWMQKLCLSNGEKSGRLNWISVLPYWRTLSDHKKYCPVA